MAPASSQSSCATVIKRTTSLPDFFQAVAPLLYQQEAIYGLILGLTENMVAKPPTVGPLLLELWRGEALEGVAIQTAPTMNLLVTEFSPESTQKLIDWMDEAQLALPGVVGPLATSERVAQLWSGRKGLQLKLGMDQKIYQLDAVTFPAGMVGELVQATQGDLDLVVEFLVGFDEDALQALEHYDERYWRELAQRMLEQGFFYLWKVAGEYVSLAGATRPTRHGVTINYVYTPKARRKRGYASMLVAALSQLKLDQGKRFCALYTDASNPTSNKIYQEVGYREIARSQHYLFKASAAIRSAP